MYTAPRLRDRRTSIAVLATALACLSLAGCFRGDRSAEPAADNQPVAAAPAPAGQVATEAGGRAGGTDPLSPVQAQRAMRITVETTVRVDTVDAATAALRGLVESHRGYVASARTYGGPGTENASFDVRVPSPSVGAFRSQVAELGTVVSDTEKAEDVTEQRADIGARVRNAHAQEKRLLDLLSDKTGTLVDVMAVEKELAAVRETIERIEAQQRVLEGQIAMATVKIELTSRREVATVGAGARIASAVGEGLQGAGTFVVGLIIAILWAGPTVLILAALGYAAFRVARFFVRRARAARARAQVSVPEPLPSS